MSPVARLFCLFPRDTDARVFGFRRAEVSATLPRRIMGCTASTNLTRLILKDVCQASQSEDLTKCAQNLRRKSRPEIVKQKQPREALPVQPRRAWSFPECAWIE
jgi:hypothetical protein